MLISLLLGLTVGALCYHIKVTAQEEVAYQYALNGLFKANSEFSIHNQVVDGMNELLVQENEWLRAENKRYEHNKYRRY